MDQSFSPKMLALQNSQRKRKLEETTTLSQAVGLVSLSLSLPLHTSLHMSCRFLPYYNCLM